MSNKVADEGNVFVCMMCGKRSRDLYGDNPIDRGWDESCMLHGQEHPITHLVMANGRVVGISATAQGLGQSEVKP